MKRRNRRYLLLLTMVLLLAFGCTAFAGGKKSKGSKAMKAYKSFLSQENIAIQYDDGEVVNYPSAQMHFSIVYLNNDDVPEMLLYWDGGSNWSATFLYACKGNKVTKCARLFEDAKGNSFGSSADRPNWYFKKKNGLVKVYDGDTYYQKFKNNKRVPWYKSYYTLYWDGDYLTLSYDDNYQRDTSFTEKKFVSLYKKAFGKSHMTKIKYYLNTDANRKKILK